MNMMDAQTCEMGVMEVPHYHILGFKEALFHIQYYLVIL